MLLNSWEAAYFDFDEASILRLAREAKALGAELLVLDDGWFGHRQDDRSSLGDWFANPAKLFTGLFYWVFVFPGELIKANCHMAKLVLGGCRKVDPGIVKIPVDLKSDYGKAALANSITLTPGTITMEIAEEEGQTWYYVHWIEAASDGEEAGEAIKGRMEKWIRRFWQ